MTNEPVSLDLAALRRNAGTHLIYEVWVSSRNVLGDLAIPLAIGVVSAKRFGDAFQMYDRIASNPNPMLALTTRQNLSSNGHTRYRLLIERLR